ncbi:MAG: copper chaperone PCu(A)C [Alphaproteobacteria bacterium]|nr:MAG: copper chaperone PCu(A)C [Alphaproteobacteria bacterium]
MKLRFIFSIIFCLGTVPAYAEASPVGPSSPDSDKPDASTAMHGTNVRKVLCPNGVAVSNFWARASTGETSAAYMRIKGAKTGAYITHVITPVAKTVEIRENTTNGVTLQMRKIGDFHIPAGKEIVFQPGDKHLLLLGLKKKLQDRHMVPLTLLFDDQSRCTVYLPVELRQPF